MKKNKLQTTRRYAFAVITLALGIALNFLEIGKDFLGFQSVGNWLIYVGFVMLAIVTLQLMSNKKKIVDERVKFIAYKASRLTFVLMILAAFSIMIIDGVKAITTPYHLFMSYMIMYMVLVYLISYKILERFN